MLKKPRVSGLWAALAFVVLFFGPAMSRADARGFRPRGAFGGGFGLRQGHVGVVGGHRAEGGVVGFVAEREGLAHRRVGLAAEPCDSRP